MKRVTFPHMGMIWVPMKVLFQKLGIDVIVPPPCSAKSLALASKYSPEFVCVPYKLVLGNFLEGLELGANTLILLGGQNNCRFGYYSILQQQVLRDLGYDFEMLTPEISSRTISGVFDVLRHLTDYKASRWDCLRAALFALVVLGDIDEIERKVQWVRARELETGTADRIFDAAAQTLSEPDSLYSLKKIKRRFLNELDKVPIKKDHHPIRVCVVGEIYVVHESYINMNLDKELGRRGVEISHSEQLSQWLVLSPALILESIGWGHEARIASAAKPYLEHLHGETIGQTVMAKRDGFDGVIQLTPFTCTPEVVNRDVLPRLQRDIDLPVLTLVLDEQTGRAGQLTRIEAFIDLLLRRQKRGGVKN